MDVDIPKSLFVDVRKTKGLSFVCTNDIDNCTHELCIYFPPVFRKFKRRLDTQILIMSERLEDLESLLPSNTNRCKRAFPLFALAGLVSAGFGASNSFVQYRRIKALQTGLTALEESNFQLKNEFLEFTKDLITVTTVTATSVVNVDKSVNQLNSKLAKVTETISEYFGMVNGNLVQLECRT